MTDEEFKALEDTLEQTTFWLEMLQGLYMKETGKRYVLPFNLPSRRNVPPKPEDQAA